MEKPSEEPDPFEFLSLDDDFIKGGTKELSADDRLRRIARYEREAAEAIERERQQRRQARPTAKAKRKLRSKRKPLLIVLTLCLVGAWIGYRPLMSDSATGPMSRDATFTTVVTGGPTLRSSWSPVPLGKPDVSSLGSGPYRFLASQPTSSQPVAYDPCRPIDIVINGRTAPAGGQVIVEEALARVSAITGLVFNVIGPTNEVPKSDRAAFQPDVYGDKWAPVLVAWTDPTEVPGLDGDVIGIGGSARIAPQGGNEFYVSGQVSLDGPQLRDVIKDDGASAARTVVMHELAHLVGLDHVDDRSTVMHPVATNVREFAPGDRAGLALLGQGACSKLF